MGSDFDKLKNSLFQMTCSRGQTKFFNLSKSDPILGSVSGLSLLSLRSRNHARFGLQTVFSFTQSDQSISYSRFSAITVLEIHTNPIDLLTLAGGESKIAL